MRAVDTNLLVRLIARDNVRQTASAADFAGTGAWVSILALVETMWVLESSYGFRAADAARAVEMLLNHASLFIQDADAMTAALHLFRQRPAVEFSDGLLLEVARKAGRLPLGTFDRKLGRAEGAELL